MEGAVQQSSRNGQFQSKPPSPHQNWPSSTTLCLSSVHSHNRAARKLYNRGKKKEKRPFIMTHHHLVTNFSGFEARGFIPLGGLEVSYISRVRVYIAVEYHLDLED